MPPPRAFSRATAMHLLYGFDVVDDESRDFLASAIASGTASGGEVERLYGLSLLAGAEDWDMRIQCATALRDRVLGGVYGPYLTPYLALITLRGREGGSGHLRVPGADRAAFEPGRILGEEGAGRVQNTAKQAPKRRRSPTTKSHFWASPTRERKRRKMVEDGLSGDLSAARRHEKDAVKATGQPRSQPVPHVQHASDAIDEVLYDGDPFENAPEADPIPKGQQLGRRRSKVTTPRPRSPVSPVQVRPLEGEAATAGHYNPPPEIEDRLHLQEDSGTEPPRQNPRRSSRATTSHYFTPAASPTKQARTPATDSPTKKAPRPPRGTISALPIPPLSADRFGLIQEELAHDPFRLLVAVTFLIRTSGRAAIPVFRDLMARYPTPEALAAANPDDIIPAIRHLGLSSNRCAAIQKYARLWVERLPTREVRYGVKNYPRPGDGRDVRAGEEFGPEDEDDVPGEEGANQHEPGTDGDPAPRTKARGFGTAWEIGHLTQGPYAIDSWRIFCRDALLGRAADWTGRGRGPEFQPEWMRVLPRDKELRACLRWMWMKEGWEWDPVTGEREVLREDLRRAVDGGRVAYDNSGSLRIFDDSEGQGDLDGPG
ncbi:Methyl-CpG-binding domain protein 4 [Pleurostoma richardsiae]|uniref:Methyl-CpG-binding domain protein 4 n=1 Tax=Pleurostoma richardsiae TaxID=41990 RepID=A0AA38RUZ0_9PEZI|nr:Methyl-CpG-binding domain protein 4 [Pleurostoma richardsiae]